MPPDSDRSPPPAGSTPVARRAAVLAPVPLPPELPALPPAEALLGWYDRHRRSLPWRARPGEAADPYRVWLSEIMLQQTTVAAVIPYFERFLARFPSVQALAAAPSGEVMAAWAGLGYYARARNLHACAQAVVARGGFPRDVEGLRALPGIGAYTAPAVAAIAFGVPVVPVDGNVERVTARLFAIGEALPAARPALARAAAWLGAQDAARARPSDFAQALFDLGATLCTASPACALCPWQGPCAARAAGIAAELPRKAARPVRPVRHGALFWLRDGDGRVLLRRRPPTGLLGGMTELPGTPWRAAPWGEAEALALAPMPGAWRRVGQAEHGFTHFTLLLDVYAAEVAAIAADGFLRPADALAAEALPTVMRRGVAVATGMAPQAGGPQAGGRRGKGQAVAGGSAGGGLDLGGGRGVSSVAETVVAVGPPTPVRAVGAAETALPPVPARARRRRPGTESVDPG